VARGRFSRFPIDLRGRPYNTLALPCECVTMGERNHFTGEQITLARYAHQNVYSAPFFPGTSNSLQPRPLNRFSRIIRQTTRFRARMCLFGVRRQKFNSYTLNSRKTAIFGPDFDGTKFSTKNRFTMGVRPCKLPLIVVVAP